MAPKVKKWTANAPAKSQVWAFAPPVTANAKTWTLTFNGKSLTYDSNGTVGDAVAGMLNLWNLSRFPEFSQITASVPIGTNPAANPQGDGTNEILALYISGTPTGGSFQLAWGGSVTPFLVDPIAAPSGADSGSAGNPNGVYRYTYTFLIVNPLGQIGETAPSTDSATVTVTNHSINVTVAIGPSGTIGKRIYRTAAGGAKGTEKLLTTIWDNTTTAYLDNIADGSLGANQPTSNTTGIPYNATATQLQGVLQSLPAIGPGNIVVTGSGTAADPWLAQFANALGAVKQAKIAAGSVAFTFAATVPAAPAVKLVVAEIQQGIKPNASPANDGSQLLLVSNAGVPFYLTTKVTGTIPAALVVNNVTPAAPPPANERVAIAAVPPTIRVDRTTAGKVGVNELQQISISPNALSGSTFTITSGANTTGNIPTPPAKPTNIGSAGTGVLTGVYYWVVTFLTAKGETEPSAAATAPGAAAFSSQQASLTIPTGPGVVTGRRIYRTLAGASPIGPYYLVTTIADNTTTSYTDNSADGTIKLNPQAPTTNGALEGELEALASIGVGNVQISGANTAAFLGMTIQQGFAGAPPVLSSAASGTAPPSGVTLAAGSGGSLASGTYYYVITSVDTSGETLGSAEQSVKVIGPTGRVVLTWTAGAGAAGYRIYRGTVAGGENTLVGVAAAPATSFIDYGKSPSALVYTVEFINALAGAPQALLTANLANITILPMIEIAETQIGYPIQNEIQEVGWRQTFGVSPPSGSYTISFPSLNVTTGALASNATTAAVLAAINKALPPIYNGAIAVTSILADGATGKGFVNALTYQGALGLAAMPQTMVNLSAMTPANGDTLLPVQTRLQAGSAVGRNEIATVTIDNSPSGGTFGLTGTLSDGNTITASGVAYNASAATLQAAFPAGTVSVSGSGGGPYTVEAEGEAGAQKVIWQATSSLTGASSVPGSPPGSNTTALPPPSGFTATAGIAGVLAADTYQYAVTATNAAGETTASQTSVTVAADGSVSLSWSAVTGATGYKLYRGENVSPNKLIATLASGSQLTFIDTGVSTATSATPPGSSTANVPTLASLSPGASGLLSAGTYYYVVTAIMQFSGESVASNELSATTGNFGDVALYWTQTQFAIGYKIYRGTATGAENLLLATYMNGSQTSFVDSGESSASAFSPPGSNSSALAAPVQSNTVPSGSGGSLATATYYYEITATTSSGETTASNEKTAAVTGPTGSVALSWAAVTGATGYKIYRGTSAGGENKIVTIIGSGATTTYTDAGVAVSSLFTAIEIDPGAAAVNEVQTITITGAGGGFYTAEFAGQQSGQIPWNAAAATLQTILQAIPTVGADNLTVSLSSSNGKSVYTVTYTGALAAHPQPLLAASDVPVNIPPSTSNGFPVPVIAIQAGTTPGSLAAGTYYYVVTAVVPVAGETSASNELSIATTGPGTPVSSVQLTWAVNANDAAYNIYRSTSPGGENLLIGTVQRSGLLQQFVDTGVNLFTPTLQGGAVYTVSLSSGATDNFTLTFGVNSTSAIAPTATAATVQSDLTGLTSIGSSNATVTGNAGGPWTVSLAASVAGTGTLSGTMVSQVSVSSGSPDLIYVVDVQNATAGSFVLNYGGAAAIQYNASAAAVKTAMEGTAAGVGNVTVTGNAGGPWTITITPKPQNSGLSIAGDGTALIGASASLAVYPLTYCLATGPNFYDAPANWSDGTLPSAYLPTPPAVAQVVPTETDATLVAGTHGSLTPLTTYYYKITATNANGETTGGTEGSGTPFAGAKFYFNATPSGGTFDLTYGGQTASSIAYNASAATIQSDLRGLSSIGSGNCTVTGTGTQSDPFVFMLAGSLLGTAPLPLSANAASLTGATISVRNTDTRSLTVWWNELPLATGYKVYRGTSAAGENALVATISGQDTTVFVDDGTYNTTGASPPTNANAWNTAVGDDEFFSGSSISCLYNVGAAIQNGYSIHGGYRGPAYDPVNSLTADSTFTGRIGLPAVNSSGYQEFRPLALQLGGPPGGDMEIDIGGGSGQGSPFINLDTGMSQVSLSVSGAAASTGTTPAVLWIGVNSDSEINLYRGSMGIGYYPGQSYEVGTIRQTYVDNPANDTSLILGAGGTGITLLVQSGGDCRLSTTAGTITGTGGAMAQDGGGVTTLLNLKGTLYTSLSTGTIAALKVSGTGEFDRSQDSRALSIGSVSLYAGATYLDPHGCTVTTGDGFLNYSLVECGYEDVTLKLGKNISAQRTQN